jgi:hypothetical protein
LFWLLVFVDSPKRLGSLVFRNCPMLITLAHCRDARRHHFRFCRPVNSQANADSKENRRGERERRSPAAQNLAKTGCRNASGTCFYGFVRSGSDRLVQ